MLFCIAGRADDEERLFSTEDAKFSRGLDRACDDSEQFPEGLRAKFQQNIPQFSGDLENITVLATPVLCFGAQAHVIRLPRLFVAWQTAWRTPLLRTDPVARGHAHRELRLQSRLLLAADTPPQWF